MSDAALDRIAAALERLAPAPQAAPEFSDAAGFVWHVDPDRLAGWSGTLDESTLN